jgi:hypothetical protein
MLRSEEQSNDGVLEAAKLVTCAWLARLWRVTPAAVAAHRHGAGADDADSDRQLRLSHQSAPTAPYRRAEAVDRNAAPIVQQIALAQATVADFDNRIAQLDSMVKAATGRGWTKTAMALVGRQNAARAGLVAERQQAANRVLGTQIGSRQGNSKNRTSRVCRRCR